MSPSRKALAELRFTTNDLATLPEDGTVREILLNENTVTTPLLPSFACKGERLFIQIPKQFKPQPKP
jgi:hypothetical protein